MKNIRFFLSEMFQFLEVKFSIYLNRRVFVMSLSLFVPHLIYFFCATDKLCYLIMAYH